MSRSKTLEQIYIEKIENGIRGIKLKTKTVQQVDLGPTFEKLRKVNPYMCDDLIMKYDNVVRNSKK